MPLWTKLDQDMGFDAVHLNLHKTFTGPHLWTSSGPVGVKKNLRAFYLNRWLLENDIYKYDNNIENSYGTFLW